MADRSLRSALRRYGDEVLGGKYAIPKGTFTTVLIPSLHRDTSVWGENPGEFNPDQFSVLKPKPRGRRTPTSRSAMVSVLVSGGNSRFRNRSLCSAMILQRFDLFDHTDYQLDIKETLSIKPDEFFMQGAAAR